MWRTRSPRGWRASRCAEGSSRFGGVVALQSVSNDEQAMKRPLGDPVRFGEAYRAHSQPILIFLTRRTYDPETALDLTAETFAKAFAGRRRFRGSTDEELAAWLFAIARNVLARFLRRGVAERRALTRLGVDVPALEPYDVARIVELAGLAEMRDAVKHEFRTLSEHQREALQLRVVEELSYVDVARRLDVSEPTARARVSRGLRVLAAALDHRQTTQETIA